jgi:serine/threonine protein kinase/tetratricopeptide (TPR) repeat protein
MEKIKQIKQYKLQKKLGTGGMGQVYKAFDTVLERDVAIKLMHQHLLDDSKNAERLLAEARAAAKLVHPNIVAIHEIGDSEFGPYIVMEYVNGYSLRKLITPDKFLEPDQVVNLISQISSGLNKAHSSQILHRDIKTENVLVSQDQLIKILDFGIAKMSNAIGLTKSGDILGTVEYMAPEQMLGGEIDHRSDIYSLGVVSYELFTRQLPFSGESAVEIIYKKLNEKPLPPSHFNREINKELDAIVLRALSISKESRWNSAEEFSNSLKDALNNPSIIEVNQSGFLNEVTESDSKEGPIEPMTISNFKTVFVGRIAEFKKIMQLFNQTKKGNGQTVIIRGEAGVGKTRLSEELKSYARHQNSWVLYGACLYQEGMDAYLPFIDALREFFSTESHSLPQDERDKIKQLIRENVPLLLEFTERFMTSFGSKSTKNEDISEDKYENLFDGIFLLISYLAKLKPLVLIIDDLQWADEATLRLFHYLSRQISDSSAMLMGIARTDRFDLHKDGKPTMTVDMLSRLRHEGLSEEIEIKRLKHNESVMLIEVSLQKTLFSDEFYDRVYHETKGNPFFLIETLKLLFENGSIYHDNSVWREKTGQFKLDVPNRVEDVFIRQISGLSDEEKEILGVAALIGYKIDTSVLSKILEIPKLNLLKKFQQIEKDLNILVSNGRDYQFEHPMLRDLLYDGMSQALRSEYHLMIAEEMEAIHKGSYGALIGDVAQHFYNGGNYQKSIPLLYEAGMRSFKLSAYKEASRFFEDYLDAVKKDNDRFPDEISQTEFYFHLGICYEEILNWDKGLTAFDRWFQLYKEVDDIAGQIHALMRIGRLHFKVGNDEKAIKCYKEALEKLEKNPVKNMFSRIYNNVGLIYFQKEDFEKAREYFSKTIDAVDDEMGQFDRANAFTNLGIISNIFGQHEDALENYNKALDIYSEKPAPENEARVYHNIGMTYSDIGVWDKSIEIFEKCMELLGEATDKQLSALTQLNMGKVYARKGNHKEAKSYTEKALKFFKRIDDILSVAEGYHILGLIETEKRNFFDAKKYFNSSLEINQKAGFKEGTAETLFAMANLMIKQGEIKEAQKAYQESIQIFEDLKLNGRNKEIKELMSGEKLKIESDSKKVKQLSNKS